MTEEMSSPKAIAWMLVGHLNEHYPHPDDYQPDPDDPLGNACCVIQCGPCSALHWIAQHATRRKVFEDQLRRTGFQRGGWSYWAEESDGLRWDWFAYYWSQHKGCGMSSGVVLPCEPFESDEAYDEYMRAALAAKEATATEPHRCPSCNEPTVYQSFSGGREFYCPGCGNQGMYEQDAPRPPRVQMLADGRFNELRTDMREEIAHRNSSGACLRAARSGASS